jgi:dihydropteroate synthase
MDPQIERLGRVKEYKSFNASAFMQAGEIDAVGNVCCQRNMNFICAETCCSCLLMHKSRIYEGDSNENLKSAIKIKKNSSFVL